MRSPMRFRAAAAVACLVLAGFAGPPALGQSGPTTVFHGSVETRNSVAGLDLSGNIVYAVDLGTGVNRTIAGVQFTGSQNPISGYTQSVSNPALDWGSYNIGTTTDDDNLEGLLASIVCCNTGGLPGDTFNFAVQPGVYQLQFLWGEKNRDSGNDNTRPFDVFIEGTAALDDVNVVGLLNADGSHVHPDAGTPPADGSAIDSQFTRYLTQVQVTDGTLNVNFGGQLIGGQTGGDRNYVLSAIIVELVPEPSALAVLGFGAAALLCRRHRRRM